MSSIICMIEEELPMQMLATLTYSNLTKFLLLAIPFFVLAGNIMEKAGISETLINRCDKMVGKRRSGLAFVTNINSCILAAISGPGTGKGAALAGIFIPPLERAG